MKAYFEINNLKVGFKTFEGVKNVLDLEFLEIKKGETFGLVGESGSGKSVLAYTILKLLSIPPGIIESGQICFNGEDLLKKKEVEMKDIRGKKISMIFQDPMSTLNPVFTVGDQIMRVLRNNKKMDKVQAQKRSLEMIELVKLPDAKNILRKYPHELSGGQRQRVIIAIALSCGAEFLIADEPTRNLDVTIQAGILKLLSELQEQLKVTVLFIANNLGLVSAVCDRVGILHEGRIVEIGNVKEIVKNPLHPYTVTLLNAIPKTKNDKINLDLLMLSGAKLGKEHTGCSYYNRCVRKEARCKNEKSSLTLIKGTHYVACYRALEGSGINERTVIES